MKPLGAEVGRPEQKARVRVPVIGGERHRLERGLVLTDRKRGFTGGLLVRRRVRIVEPEVRRRRSGENGLEVGVEMIGVVSRDEVGEIGKRHVNGNGMEVEGRVVGVEVEVEVEVEVGVIEEMEGL